MVQIFLVGPYTIESVFRLQNNHDTIDPSHRVNSAGFEVLESLLVGHGDDLQSGLDFLIAKRRLPIHTMKNGMALATQKASKGIKSL